MEDGEMFCGKCGAAMEEGLPIQGRWSQIKKMACKKNVFWAAVTAAVLVVVVGGGIIFSRHNAGNPSEYLIYSKKNTTIQYCPKNGKSLEITHNATADKTFPEILYSIGNVVCSKDGKYVFYTEKVDDDSNGNLMYKNLKKQSDHNDTSEKLASGVYSCQPLSSGNILYTKKKHDSKDLYLSDLNGRTKIDSGIRLYIVSKDESSLIYLTADKGLYLYDLAKKDASKVKLDSDVSYVSASDDLNYIYYKKGRSLMCIKNRKDPEQIASGLSDESNYQRKGNSAYYLIPTNTYKVTDYMKDDDAGDGSTYSQKQKRNEIRSRVEYEDSFSLYDLYLYDGKSSAKIADSVEKIQTNFASIQDGENMALCISRLEPDKLKKFSLSDLGSKYNVSYNIKKWKSEAMNYALVTGTDVHPLDAEGMLSSPLFDYKNHIYYYTIGRSLYSISYSQTGVKQPKLISDDAPLSYLMENQLVYLSDYDTDGNGTLNIQGKKVDDDVSMVIYAVSSGKDDSVYYAKDVDFENYTVGNNSAFTLYRYQNGRKMKVADDVMCFKPLENGNVAYLQDYDLDTHKGDLYLWGPEKKNVKIDEDVTYIQNGYNCFGYFYG